MSGKQQLVAGAGAGLLAANFWTGKDRKALNAGAFAAGATDAQQQAAHAVLKQTGLAVLFIAAATLAAGVSDNIADAMLTIIVGLFILFLINRNAASTKGA